MNKSKLPSEIIWEDNGGKNPDDFSAVVDNYLLRVEQMHKTYWWWGLYCDGEEVDGAWYSEKPSKTKNAAFDLVHEAYVKHKTIKK